ncbi:hypothetical protein [Sulfurirhabdus autotrophica]|uniref:Uncharacterized protein n=1 Tax=Sulfurirhabdus autotrophica TaxID=1706046 RepID=A0A4R3Y337_9PROT|nr:hypothetical protein [Sulfurirhabdus autotrophica]TCV85902.1 hypothetical protein EDC63_108110 [Sulfurirhabdus autotrophica]
MIVPQYWAESRTKHRKQGKQITAHRFGWSDTSQEEAQANADSRAQEALKRLISGEKLVRREPKTPYNGAEGVPIREEIVSRHGETIITRNAYGARCLNTPDVFFADIDFQNKPSTRSTLNVYTILLGAAAVIWWFTQSKVLGISLLVSAILFSSYISNAFYRAMLLAKGGAERVARNRISHFLEQHPAWNMRVYRTPAGMRVMATHQTFNPGDPAVTACFNALGTDPIYMAMCLNQQCFRARVSAKPWRIGVDQHIKPRPGTWPVTPERLPDRNAWIQTYETAAESFAACTLIETIGSGVTHPDAKLVQELHDKLCKATSQLPIA